MLQSEFDRNKRIEDTRAPLQKLRRRELMRVARKQGFDVNDFMTKGDLLRILHAGDAAQKAARMVMDGGASPERPVPSAQVSQERAEKARREFRKELEGMNFFALRTVASDWGVQFDRTTKKNDLIERIMEKADGV